MSRIGRRHIPLPSGVSIQVQDEEVVVKGKNGELRQDVNPQITVREVDDHVVVERSSESRDVKALHGLYRALIANMVTGVNEGFTRTLELVGYRAQVAGKGVNIQLGYSHPVVVEPMDGVSLEVEGVNRIHVRGIDKQVVGEQAARIRRLRPPDAYKGKGIRYAGEVLRLKPGKAAGKR